jgi:hypothetical protein
MVGHTVSMLLSLYMKALEHCLSIPGYRADRFVIAVMNYTEMESKVRIPTGVPPYSDLRAGQPEDNAIARYVMGQISLLEH